MHYTAAAAITAEHNLLVCTSQGVSGRPLKGFPKKRFAPTSKAAPPAAQEIAKVLLGTTWCFYPVHSHIQLNCDSVHDNLVHCLPVSMGLVRLTTIC